MPIWDKIEQEISDVIHRPFQLKKQVAVAGGDINQAYHISGEIEDDNQNIAVNYFIKLNHKNLLSMFEAEAAGLREIEASQAVRVPRVICYGAAENQSYLILERLDLGHGTDLIGSNDSAIRLGQQLALMHKTSSKQFGWSRDNTIGATKQVNQPTDRWIDFWREHRLGFQFNLASQKSGGHSLTIKGEKLLDNLERFFIGYKPEVSLLHGDLWSGNYGYLENGDPVIFDPAVYYGDREADIAMTELFGGFPPEFYSAYNKAWPLETGYKDRKTLYNLYHILNHYNLFGGGYAMQAEKMIEQLLESF